MGSTRLLNGYYWKGQRPGRYIVGGSGRKMIFWGQYIVSPRAQTTQTIPGGGWCRNVFLLPHFEEARTETEEFEMTV